jgi:hypothetical protein
VVGTTTTTTKTTTTTPERTETTTTTTTTGDGWKLVCRRKRGSCSLDYATRVEEETTTTTSEEIPATKNVVKRKKRNRKAKKNGPTADAGNGIDASNAVSDVHDAIDASNDDGVVNDSPTSLRTSSPEGVDPLSSRSITGRSIAYWATGSVAVILAAITVYYITHRTTN